MGGLNERKSGIQGAMGGYCKGAIKTDYGPESERVSGQEVKQVNGLAGGWAR